MDSLAGRNQNETTKILAGLVVVICLSTLPGCLTDSGTSVTSEPGTVTQPLTAAERTVCDPFHAGVTAEDRGLIGNLVYLAPEQRHNQYQDVESYIDNGVPAQVNLYFDKMFIPPSQHDRGIYNQLGHELLDEDGQPVFEYFGLRVQGRLQLASNENPSWYQMAVLSDDGSILSLKNEDGSLTPLVDNDGQHAIQMGCANHAIYLDHSTNIPVVLDYYQGPRYHLSLVVMWRPMPAGSNSNDPVSDPMCGQAGDNLYFNWNQDPVTPTATYVDMLSRGWKPLGNENYDFPAQPSNPCAPADPLLITNFAISTTTPTSVTVSWVTSIAASTQAQVTDANTGQVYSASVNGVMTTNHSVTVTGLTSDSLYSVQGTSISADGQSITSTALGFRTPR